MRNLPNNIADTWYLIQKIRISPIRGLLIWPFLRRGSSIPFIGANVTCISPSRLKVGRLCYIGASSYLDAHALQGVEFGAGVTLREGCIVQCRSGLNEPGIGLQIGNGTFIGPYCKIGVGGFVKIGSNVQLGCGVSINAESHDESDGSFTGGKVSRRGVKIDNNVWIGDKAVILDGVNIGENSVIGAGAVVTKDVPPSSVVVGVPAKPLYSI